jgi:anaerobic magnesium-protoporphyrin IX monomethyl ester cyclase
MKVLLANPPGPWLRCRWDIKTSKSFMKYYPFPVRLSYATAVLKKSGYDAHIVDATAEEMDRRQFISKFKEMDPDLLIWETTASSFDYDLKTMKMLKEIKPKLLIAASGYHATPAYNECLKAGYDFVIVGECEYSILDLVRWLSKDSKAFPRGVTSKKHKLIARPLIQNIDELPWPEREELPMEKYNDPKLHGFNVVMVTSRGCPWGCNFCTVDVYYQKKNYRMRNNIKDVVDEMEYLWKNFKPDELYFDDDNFAVSKKHVSDICKEVIRRKLIISWNCMVDARVDFQTMKLMKRAGCSGITIGAESADDNVLKQMEGKPINRKDIEFFVKSCKGLKMRSHICWVLGMKGSSKESDMETIRFAIDLPSDTLQFSVCVPYYGTPMYKWCEKNGFLAIKDWKDFTASDKSICNFPGYTHKDIEDMLVYARKMWYRKMIKKRPDILLFHIYNLYKYQGLSGVIRISAENLKKVF